MRSVALVDLQVNGYRGIDFSDAGLTADGFTEACERLLDAGTGAFLATLITVAPEAYEHNLPLIAEVMASGRFAGQLLGVHLEGPFLNPAEGAHGSHDPQWIVPPNIHRLDHLLDLADGCVRLLTIAADVPGAEDLARHARRRGLAVSLGHHLATPEDLTRLHAAGAAALTHLGNGMPAVVDRHTNPLFAGLDADGLSAMIITDGHHLPPPVIKTIVRTKGPARCIVVSDASPIAGLPPGRYRTLGNDVILEPGGRLYNPQTGYLVGSSATILDCMNHLASLNLLAGDALIAAGWTQPLALIGVDPADVRPRRTVTYDEDNRRFILD
ncbi:MAG TPA: N-acetylglucosamine-6-phosphate deacetylase [Halothiobacillaceae bacterium]|nr:N-acetylglucosamine-6-phosphate deacetylase [Halothiobacillaceae bacterium]